MPEKKKRLQAKKLLQDKKTDLTYITQSLRNSLRKQERENKKLKGQLGDQKRVVQMMQDVIIAEPPYTPYRFYIPKKGKEIFPVIQLSDWQIGEVIDGKAIENFGNFNWDIAQERIFEIVDSMLQWIHVQRTAYQLKECHVFLQGDFISGDIHEGLSLTNEFPLPVQAVKAGKLQGEVLRRIGSHFNTLVVWRCAMDNHARLTKKIQFKEGALNNMNQVVYAMAEARMERMTNLYWQGGNEMKLLAKVGKRHRFLIEHGNHVKAYMGTPYYSLEREFGREASKRMMTAKGFHFQAVGHWHVPAIIAEKIFVNGCLTGTTELDHSVGRNAEPAQVAMMVNPNRGIFNRTAFTASV
jgi:hypothetical protein